MARESRVRGPMTPSKADAWSSPILHADLDAFYASVETLSDPSLKGKPVIVGGTSSRGVVTSASYEARKFGVRSAMPTSRARRLCPGGIFIQPNFAAYTEKSRAVKEVFTSMSPLVEPLSLDEAFIDVSGSHRMWADPPTMAEALRWRVADQTGLVVSVGVAPNKFLAKLASRRAKPDGVVVVRPGGIEDFLSPLPVDELWGVGEQTSAVLRKLGLTTIGEIAAVPRSTLERVLGATGTHLANLARGKDERQVVPEATRRSVGAEETFQEDLVGETEICQALLKLADRVSSRLRGDGISGQTVTVKVRFSNFATITRSRTLRYEIDNCTGFYGVARQLLAGALSNEPGRSRIRLLGISASSIKQWPAAEQLTFDRQPRWIEADRALDKVRARFGDDALGFGSLMGDE